MSEQSHRPLTLRMASLALAVATASSLVAGCSGSGSSSSSSSTPSAGASVSAKSLADRITAAEQSAKYFHVQEKTSEAGATAVDVDIHLTGSDSRDLNLSSGTSGMRAIGNDYYLYSADATDGKPWMSVLASNNSQAAKSVREGVKSGGAGYATSDPQSTWSKGTATYVGSDSTGQHYKVVVPADVVLDSLMAGTADANSLKALKSKTATYDVWLGAKDRPAKSVLDISSFGVLDESSTSTSSTSKRTMTVIYSKWETAFTVSVPPADKTVTVDERLGSLNGSSSSSSGASSSSSAAN